MQCTWRTADHLVVTWASTSQLAPFNLPRQQMALGTTSYAVATYTLTLTVANSILFTAKLQHTN